MKWGANTRAIAHIPRERQMCSSGWATVAKRSTEAREAGGRSPKREGRRDSSTVAGARKSNRRLARSD